MGGLAWVHLSQMGVEAMAETRFCKDCKHMTFAKACTNLDFVLPAIVDLVSGDEHSDERACSEARADESLCGTYGRGFEPK